MEQNLVKAHVYELRAQLCEVGADGVAVRVYPGSLAVYERSAAGQTERRSRAALGQKPVYAAAQLRYQANIRVLLLYTRHKLGQIGRAVGGIAGRNAGA